MFFRASAAISAVVVILAAGFLLRGPASVGFHTVAAWISEEIAQGENTLGLAPITLGNPAAAATLQTRIPERPRKSAASTPPEVFSQRVTVGRGDTLASVLTDAGVPMDDVRQAVAAARSEFDPRDLRAGQALRVVFKDVGPVAPPTFNGFTLRRDYQSRVVVERGADGGYASRTEEIPLTRVRVATRGTIHASLYEDGVKAGLSPGILAEMIRIYSWDVDFQRDIRDGDEFSIFFERLLGENGEVVREGPILSAELVLRDVPLALTRYADFKGNADYFNVSGASVQKALLRTPIDGARLSSRFGARNHPILGYTKMHRGVDFAAPTNTPIYAAGSGSVEVAGWNGAYGRYVRIRHNGEFSTAYAHMNRIAVRSGERVRQGEVIGYVGTTGRSTGPHLHYEILRANRQVDPMTVKMPSGRILAGRELAEFERHRQDVAAQFDKALARVQFADRRS